jgi:hypothetical protein
MRIGLFHLKQNRTIYTTMYNAIRIGFKKCGIPVSLFDREDRDKDFSNMNFDLAVTFTNSIGRIGNIKRQQEKKKERYLTLYISPIQNKEFLHYKNRDHYINSTDENLLIYCDLLAQDYKRHFYLEERIHDRYNKHLIFIEKANINRKDDGYIVIPEQVFPEGITKEGDLQHLKTKFIDWFRPIYKNIRSVTDRKIVIKKHPNPRGPVIKLKEFENVEVTDIDKGVLLKNSHSLITLSSKLCIESALNNIPTILKDLNSIVYPICHNDELKVNDIRPDPVKKTEFLTNIAYSIWTKKELDNGTYVNYLMKELIPAYDKRNIGV